MRLTEESEKNCQRKGHWGHRRVMAGERRERQEQWGESPSCWGSAGAVLDRHDMRLREREKIHWMLAVVVGWRHFLLLP